MVIEIHRPELEQFIRERMASGAFASAEDALWAALHPGGPAAAEPMKATSGLTGQALIDAMQRSPHKEIELVPESFYPDISKPLF